MKQGKTRIFASTSAGHSPSFISSKSMNILSGSRKSRILNWLIRGIPAGDLWCQPTLLRNQDHQIARIPITPGSGWGCTPLPARIMSPLTRSRMIEIPGGGESFMPMASSILSRSESGIHLPHGRFHRSAGPFCRGRIGSFDFHEGRAIHRKR